MKKILLVSLILLSIRCNSQINVGFNIQPEISFANWEIFWYSNSYGITANIPIYKRVFLSTGMGFQSKNYDLSMVPALTDGIPIKNYVIRTIPFSIRAGFTILKLGKRIQCYGLAGTKINFCIYEKTTFSNQSIPIKVNRKPDLYNVLLNFGIGMKYTINKIALFVEPNFNTSIHSNCKYYHPYYNIFSMSIGFIYIFKPS